MTKCHAERSEASRSLVTVRAIIFAAAALLLPTACGGDEGGMREDLSGFAGAFADVGLGLRPLGMGGAYTALATDEHSARWNPALLGEVEDPIAGFSWARQFNLISYSYLAVSYPVKESLGVGAYVITAGDDIYRETTIGAAAGVPGNILFLPELIRIGATVKLYLADYGNDSEGGDDRVQGSAFGYGIDVAAALRLSDEFLFTVVGRDLVNDVTWDSSVKGSYSEGAPRAVAVAGAFQDDQIAISFDFQPPLYSDVPTRLGIGAEIVLLGALKPRLGLSQNFGSGDPNRWVTVGLGVNLEPSFLGPIHHVMFGYTHLIHEIDATPRVGLTIGW